MAFQDRNGVWRSSRRERKEASAHHRALWRVEQTLNQPGARARLLHQRYLAEERDLLKRAEQTDDEHEKARLTADAATFRRYADEQEAEGRNGDMKTTADVIRKRMTTALNRVAQKYALVKPEDDEQYPADYQLKRRVAREELLREWRTIESRETAELAQWSEEAAANADALYLSDPVTDAAHESRRVAERLEAQELATPFVGQPQIMVKNRLLPHVQRFIATGNLDRARVFLSAARIAGVEDGRLDQALTAAEDATIPHRKAARDQQRAIAEETDVFRAEMYGARIIHGIGSDAELNRASTMSKMIEWRKQNGLYPVPGSGAGGTGDTSGASGDATE